MSGFRVRKMVVETLGAKQSWVPNKKRLNSKMDKAGLHDECGTEALEL
jgi:hypothetical protein